MKVTAQWIAEQCGVSRGTVDRVVNGRPNVAPEVPHRRNPAELGCVFHPPDARGHSRGCTQPRIK